MYFEDLIVTCLFYKNSFWSALQEDIDKEIQEHMDLEILRGNLEPLAKVLRYKIKEKLSKSYWFASLDMEKQDLLTRYIQSRMCQKYALNNLEQVHQKNLNLVSTVKQGHSNLGN